MIEKLVDAFIANSENMLKRLRIAHPESYDALIYAIIETLKTGEWDSPDSDSITVARTEDYSRRYYYIIGANDCETIYFLSVEYGTCSGCDELCAIEDQSEVNERGEYEPPTDKQVEQYFDLCLEIVKNIKRID